MTKKIPGPSPKQRVILSLMIPRRRIAILQAITSFGAVVALVVSIVAFSARLDAVTASRLRSNTDFCNLIHNLVGLATPRDREAAARRFLDRAGLSNCHTYAIRTVNR